MFCSDLLVIAGLSIDAIGASFIVIPDLPKKIKVGLINLTPILRQYQKKGDKCRGRSDSELVEIIEDLWPAIKKHDLGVSTVEVNQLRDISDLRDDTLEVTTEDGEEIILAIQDVEIAVSKYINNRYRFVGFVLLIIGFMVQIIGNVL